MRCLECGVDLDELNESQPVCPFCGTLPCTDRDDDDVCALLDEAALITIVCGPTEYSDPGVDPIEPVRMPIELQEALDDAESLLLAVGLTTFDRPEGFRIFPLLTERIM